MQHYMDSELKSGNHFRTPQIVFRHFHFSLSVNGITQRQNSRHKSGNIKIFNLKLEKIKLDLFLNRILILQIYNCIIDKLISSPQSNHPTPKMVHSQWKYGTFAIQILLWHFTFYLKKYDTLGTNGKSAN